MAGSESAEVLAALHRIGWRLKREASSHKRSLLSKLGKHRMGKVCLYFRQLADLDKSVLEQLVTNSVAEVRRRYG